MRKEFVRPNGWTKWLRPRMRGFLQGCCDCGLVHRLQFRVLEGEVYMRGQRARGHTALLRRRKRHAFTQRSAVTGRYVAGTYAKRHPKTTVRERRA